MNKRIDFTYNGGFPATQYMTDYMQQSYRSAFMGLAGLIGDKVILTGVEKVGDQVTNGWISVNGELLPFVGSAWADDAQVVIVETSETRLFQDNNSHSVYFKREARIGSPGLFAFADLKPNPLKSIVPAGLISMWSGAIDNIPTGWALCDGTNGTPNLSSKFIVGYDAADADYNAIGKTGGGKTHTLTKQEMPAHEHFMFSNVKVNTSLTENNYPAKGDAGEHYLIAGTGGAPTLGKSSSVGGGSAFDKRPTFFTLAYIIKL